jgi:hypothetical protein
MLICLKPELFLPAILYISQVYFSSYNINSILYKTIYFTFRISLIMIRHVVVELVLLFKL